MSMRKRYSNRTRTRTRTREIVYIPEECIHLMIDDGLSEMMMMMMMASISTTSTLLITVAISLLMGQYTGLELIVRSTSYKPKHLVSLDFDTEKLTISELPQSSDDTDSWTDPFLLRESLALLCVSRVITKILVLKQEEGGNRGWGLWFSGPSIRDDLTFHLAPSRTISHLGKISILYHEGTDGGYIFFGKVPYSIATGKLHLLGKSMTCLLHLQTYCESLVLCSGFETEDMTSSPSVVLHK